MLYDTIGRAATAGKLGGGAPNSTRHVGRRRSRAVRPGARDCASHGHVRGRTMRRMARSQARGASARRLREMSKRYRSTHRRRRCRRRLGLAAELAQDGAELVAGLRDLVLVGAA